MVITRGAIIRKVVVLHILVIACCVMYYLWIVNADRKLPWTHVTKATTMKTRSKVGFGELQGSDCMGAFSNRLKNRDFPQTVQRISLEEIRNDSRDCDKFIRDYGFDRYPPATEEELDFPLAYTVLFHQDLDQVLYLLRAVYRSHNVYCLSVDAKTRPVFQETVRQVTKCFPNIIMASKMERIVYAGFERLKADINCMVDLARHRMPWRYVINMVGQQFPLRTNLEIVRILKLYNGISEVEVLPASMRQDYRFIYKHIYLYSSRKAETEVRMTFQKNPPPPYEIEIRKGSVFGSFSRQFIDYVLNEPIIKEFLDWCRTVYSPDEYFWSSIQFGQNLDVPGGYGGVLPENRFITVYASWPRLNPCATMRVRMVCIFSPEDLPTLDAKYHLFANKFYLSHHPAALHCLDERIYNYTVRGVVRDLTFYEDQVASMMDISNS